MFSNLKISDHIKSQDELVRNSIDLKNSQDWELVCVSSIAKEEVKYSMSKIEIIYSYLHAADILSKNINLNGNIKVLTLSNVCLPFLYLCRQTAELAIKYALEITGIKIPKPTHNIKNLWKRFKEENEDKIFEKDKAFIDIVSNFVDVISLIDYDGMHLRYATSNENKLYRDKPYLIHPKNFIAELNNLVIILTNIDL